MGKLSEAALNRIKEEVERIPYGKVTIVVNESQGDVDIVVEERLKYKKELCPQAGQVLGRSFNHG